MVRFHTFRPTLTVLTLLAMLFGTIVPAAAMCGLASQDTAGTDRAAAAETDDPHAAHRGMTVAQPDAGPTEAADGMKAGGMKACDMCVGDGLCDHGICTPALASGPERTAARVPGDHDAPRVPSLVSLTLAHQTPPPRTHS